MKKWFKLSKVLIARWLQKLLPCKNEEHVVTVKISRNLVYISLKPYLKREVLVKGTAKLLHANSQINNCRF